MRRRRQQGRAQAGGGARRVLDLLQIGAAGDADEEPHQAHAPARSFPLHLDGAEPMRFRYALFLLNKVGGGACSACAQGRAAMPAECGCELPLGVVYRRLRSLLFALCFNEPLLCGARRW